MKPVIVIAGVIAFVGVAFAECDFPFYPEYADLFSQYDEVKPLMAKKATIAKPGFTKSSGDVVCEPLLLKNYNGMPICYMVATYAGEDLEIVNNWNKIIKNINYGRAVPAKSLAEEISFFYSKDIIKDFRSLTISAYTYDVPVVTASGGFPALIGYVAAYEAAVEHFGNDEFYFTGIIAAGFYTVQIFVFEDDSRERLAIKVNEFREASLADLGALAEASLAFVQKWYKRLKEEPELGERNQAGWRNLMGLISDDQATQEFTRVIEALPPVDEETDVEGVLDKVPDPNRNLGWPSGTCYAWAPASAYVYKCQQNDCDFGLWEGQTLPFDEGWGASSPTQRYCYYVFSTYLTYCAAQGLIPGVPSNYQAWKMTLAADQFTKGRQYVEEKAFKYEVWSLSIGSEPCPMEIEGFEAQVPWEVIQGVPLNLYGPVVVCVFDWPEFGKRHACPCRGFRIEFDADKYIKVWDMDFPPYDEPPIALPHWETSEAYAPQCGIRMDGRGPLNSRK